MAKKTKSKEFRFETLTAEQLSDETFKNDKLLNLDMDADTVISKALSAIENGGNVYAAYSGDDIAIIDIFEKSQSKKEGSIYELVFECDNYDLVTEELYSAFIEKIKGILIPLSETYDVVRYKDDELRKKPVTKTKFSFVGMGIGFAVGFLIFGLGMRNILLGIILGIAFAVMVGIVFSSNDNALKAAGIGDENIDARKNMEKNKS